MADLDLVRDILDEQLVDEHGRPIGKADGVVMELREDGPPRLVAIEIGLPVLGYRLHPALGRLLERFNRWMGLPHNGCVRVPFEGFEVRATEIEMPVDGEAIGTFGWENWVRRHIVGHLPGGHPHSAQAECHEDSRSSRGIRLLAGCEPGLGTSTTEIHVERLIGRMVVAPDGKNVGRIEEVRVERQGDAYVVSEYLLGTSALLERLSLGTIFRHRGSVTSGIRAWWHQLDVTEPERPRLTCPPEELRTYPDASDA